MPLRCVSRGFLEVSIDEPVLQAPPPRSRRRDSPTLDYAATGDAAGSGTSEAGTQTTGLTPEAGVQRHARRPRWWADRSTISKCCWSWGVVPRESCTRPCSKSLERLVAVKVLQYRLDLPMRRCGLAS